MVGQDEWLYADEKNALKYDQRTIIKVSKLYDVALVVYPAYKDTEASVRHLEERKAEFLRLLQSEDDGEQGDTGPDPAEGTDGSGEPNTDTPPAPDAPSGNGSNSRKRTVEYLKIKP